MKSFITIITLLGLASSAFADTAAIIEGTDVSPHRFHHENGAGEVADNI